MKFSSSPPARRASDTLANTHTHNQLPPWSLQQSTIQPPACPPAPNTQGPATSSGSGRVEEKKTRKGRRDLGTYISFNGVNGCINVQVNRICLPIVFFISQCTFFTSRSHHRSTIYHLNNNFPVALLESLFMHIYSIFTQIFAQFFYIFGGIVIYSNVCRLMMPSLFFFFHKFMISLG